MPCINICTTTVPSDDVIYSRATEITIKTALLEELYKKTLSQHKQKNLLLYSPVTTNSAADTTLHTGMAASSTKRQSKAMQPCMWLRSLPAPWPPSSAMIATLLPPHISTAYPPSGGSPEGTPRRSEGCAKPRQAQEQTATWRGVLTGATCKGCFLCLITWPSGEQQAASWEHHSTVWAEIPLC